MKFVNSFAFVVIAVGFAAGQTPSPTQTPLSIELARNFEAAIAKRPSSDVRRQAYAKLLEAQRFLWSSGRLRSQAGQSTTMRLARESFKKAVEIDPTLAEGYTALAELAISIPPGDADEAIRLAEIAVKAAPKNFGAHRILARVYTYKSKLNSSSADPAFLRKAASEWELVTGLDQRNAEGWAFLSEIYDRLDRPKDQVAALRKWLGAGTAIDVQFYRSVMGSGESLSPESARLKLGTALMKVGETREAIETLSVAVADDPDDFAAVDMLREAVSTAGDGPAIQAAIGALAQAVYASPQNISLIKLLAEIQAKAGRLDDAVSLLKTSVQKRVPADKPAASVLQMSLGDVYANLGRSTDAIAAYEEALRIRGLDKTETVTDEEREFAMALFERMIKTLKAANKPDEARAVIQRARKLLGDADLFSDRQLISLYREFGMRSEALTAVKSTREKVPSDPGLLRLEATLLTETGKVDEAVALVKATSRPQQTTAPVSGTDSQVAISVPAFDEFSNYIFISSLYGDAGRPKEAAEAANQALSVARGAERKQIARLTLASARQNSGDYTGAESILQEILKESPRNPIALNNLGYFLLERNERLQEALAMIKQSVEIDPTNPSFLDSLGWAYFKLGKLAEAEKYLSQAAVLDSSSATIQEHLGDVFNSLGRGELARTAWGRSLKLASSPTDLKRLEKKLASDPKLSK